MFCSAVVWLAGFDVGYSLDMVAAHPLGLDNLGGGKVLGSADRNFLGTVYSPGVVGLMRTLVLD